MKKVGFIFTAFAIALQAFGHHALAPHLTLSQLSLFETASRYMVWASLWLLLFSFQKWDPKYWWALRLIAFGVLLFCGSLFLYLFFPIRVLMILTPLGGVSMIVGFVWLGIKFD